MADLAELREKVDFLSDLEQARRDLARAEQYQAEQAQARQRRADLERWQQAAAAALGDYRAKLERWQASLTELQKQVNHVAQQQAQAAAAAGRLATAALGLARAASFVPGESWWPRNIPVDQTAAGEQWLLDRGIQPSRAFTAPDGVNPLVLAAVNVAAQGSAGE